MSDETMPGNTVATDPSGAPPAQPRPTPESGPARASISIFLTLAAIACANTLIFLPMRAVMDIGGFCAEGGPFVIEHQCPEGTNMFMLIGVWGWIIALIWHFGATTKHNVVALGGLAWSALFLSLGYNFVEYGLNPPGDQGIAWAWLLCAAVFAAMGGLPLLAIGAHTMHRIRTARSSVVRRAAGQPPAKGEARAGAYWIGLQVAAIAAGIAGATAWFNAVTG